MVSAVPASYPLLLFQNESTCEITHENVPHPHVYFHANQSHFHLNRFARRVVLKLTQKATWKWSITIHRTQNDGDWYFYLQCLALQNRKNAHENAQKSSKTLKPIMNKVVSTGKKFANFWLSVCHMDCVRFARYCCRCHLFI